VGITVTRGDIGLFIERWFNMVKDNVNKKIISFDGIKTTYQLTITCELCGKESIRGNVFASKYCEACAKKMERENHRLRSIEYRKRKKLSAGG